MRRTGTHRSIFRHMQPLRVQIIIAKLLYTQEERTAQSDLFEEEPGVVYALCVAAIEPLGARRLFDVDPVETGLSLAPGADR